MGRQAPAQHFLHFGAAGRCVGQGGAGGQQGFGRCRVIAVVRSEVERAPNARGQRDAAVDVALRERRAVRN